MHVTFFEARAAAQVPGLTGGRHIRAGAEHNRRSAEVTAHDRTLRLGVVMDPIGAIKYAKDSTLAMLLAAQARGFDAALPRAAGPVAARRRGPGTHAAAHRARRSAATGSRSASPRRSALGELDCLLMRKDPPFDTEYIYTTYILERAEEQGALVVNRPQGLRDMNEKVYTAWFPQCCAPTLITPRHGRHGGLPARARQDRRASRSTAWAAARSSCSSQGDKNAQRGVRDPDRLRRSASRSRSATSPRSSTGGDSRVLLDRRRAGAVRARAHSLGRATTAATSPPAPRASAGR